MEKLNIKEQILGAVGVVSPFLALAAVALATSGCASKTRNVEVDGMFTQAEAGIVAIGSADVMASPAGEETAIVKYEEDTAWLSPTTKTHAIRIQLTGTNAVNSASAIVDSICRAFTGTNRVEVSAQ